MRLKLLAAAMVGAAITAPACAMAGTVIESAPIPTTNVPFTYTFELPSFDTSLGTLTSVVFELTDTATASVVVANITDGTMTFTNALANIPLTVTGPGGLSVSSPISADVVSGSVAAHTISTWAGVSATNSVSNMFTSGLSAFELNPVVDLTYVATAAAGHYDGTSEPGLLFGGTATAGGNFEIIYNYTSAVPEPGTWAFLMLGVGAIGVAMRRRKDGLALAAA
jgi:hypothetical protein